MGAAHRGHEAGLAQLRDQVLEVGERQRLGLGDRGEGDRLGALGRGVAGAAAELDHQSHAVFGLGREQHRD